MTLPAPFLGFPDRTPDELLDLVELARDLKGGRARGHLQGKVVVLYFMNPSLRTRASLEAGVARLGGSTVVLDAGSGGVWGLEHRDGALMDGAAAEHVREAAKVLSRYGDAIGVRAFAEGKSWPADRAEPMLSAFGRHATVPVFSLEGAARHPLQGLADAQTLQEKLGEPRGKKLVLSWLPHPSKALPMAVPNSVVEAGALLGMEVVIARPDGWALDPSIVAAADALARARGGSVHETTDRDAALRGAHVVYGKSWGSIERYGNPEGERAVRSAVGGPWVMKGSDLAKGAGDDGAWFMHCLPVRRGVKVLDEVLDGPRSAVIDQAENRLWTSQAVLLRLLDGGIQRMGKPAREGPLLA
jgi:N-acetylornithine carbamoyltransferase